MSAPAAASAPRLGVAAPFACTFTPGVPDLLRSLGVTLALTTYQAGKVALLSPSGGGLTQLLRTFPQAMGLAVEGAGPSLRLAVATSSEVTVLANAPGLAPGYAPQPGTYDALFLPRARYVTGPLDLHDLAWGAHEGRRALWAVNTRFSALCVVDETASFRPVWRPPFVTDLQPEDRCHLNGMALRDGRPAFATAFAATDTPQGWRADPTRTGVLVEVESGEVVLGGLPMPHSPRLVGGRLFVLASATGALLAVDAEAGTAEEVCRLPGFVRGMGHAGDYLFVGLSKLRKGRPFGDLPLAGRDPQAGVAVVDLHSGRVAGLIRYVSSCEEIFEVQALPGVLRPGVLGPDQDAAREAVVAPSGCWWSRPEP